MSKAQFFARFAAPGALAAAALLVAVSAWAQGRPAPAPATPAAQAQAGEFKLNGFRSANFGMTAEQVRQAIRKDFNIGPDKIETVENPVERTQILAVTVPDLLPTGGPAQVAYVIGFKTKQLVLVSVTWGGPVNPQLSVAGAVDLARTLQSYLVGVGYKADTVVTGVVQPDGSVLFFRGDDSQGRRTILVAGGVAAPEGQKPAGVPTVQVSYSRDPQTPDVFQIRKGDF
ncbi:MAG: hypothetical protein HY059_21535 [Proteobacteria bacterium]|nr:hypothetical protein [Pseudomonadota bacterium]